MVSMRYEINNTDPEEKKQFIKKMFTAVAPTYDALNRVLSLGIDRLWRRLTVRSLGNMRGKMVLDLCCGTGDLSRNLTRRGARVVSLDFCEEMIRRGLEKKNLLDYCVIADASRLPLCDNSFDAVTIAFGIRNIPDLDRFIAEVRRVLKPGGIFSILELTRPNLKTAGLMYRLYLGMLLPLIGKLISGKMTPYRYLSTTISTFLNPRMLAEHLVRHGFTGTGTVSYTLGVATLINCRNGAKVAVPVSTSRPQATALHPDALH